MGLKQLLKKITKQLWKIYFPCSYMYSAHHIPLLWIFPTYLTYPVKQNKLEFWITVLMDLLHFLGPHLLCKHLSNVLQTRNLCNTPRSLTFNLNEFDSTSPMSNCKLHLSFQCDLSSHDWHKKSVRVDAPKEPPKLLCLNVKNTSSSELLISFW